MRAIKGIQSCLISLAGGLAGCELFAQAPLVACQPLDDPILALARPSTFRFPLPAPTEALAH